MESTSPLQDDFKAYQDLLKGVATALDIQPEEVQEKSHRLVDILITMGLSRIALPVNNAILDPIKSLWQTPFSLPLTSKRVERR